MRRIWDWIWADENMWALLALIVAVYGFGSTFVRGRWMIGYSLHPMLLIAILGTVFGSAQLLRQRWARWVGVAWLGTLVFMSLSVVAATQFSWRSIVGLLLVAATVYYYFAYFFRRRPSKPDDDEGDDRPFLSLVLLFRELPYLDRQVIATLAQKAWGVDFHLADEEESSGEDQESSASDDDSRPFIVGEPPMMVVKHPEAMLLIHVFDRPYFDDPAEVAEQLTELRVRNAVLDHRAWVAVDVVGWLGETDDENDIRAAYRLIARLLAELADDQVLAVIDTEAQQVFPYDPETERKLRSDDPCGQLRELYYAPIIQIADDDPAMLAAVAEARARFPEFVAAFESRDPTSEATYSVKAPLGQGDDIEFMWMEVSGIENETVYGVLGNEPSRGKLKLGDRVRTPVSEINDWVYLRGDDLVGGFTVKLLTERASRGPTAS